MSYSDLGDDGRRRSSSSRRAPTRSTRSTTCSRASPAAATTHAAADARRAAGRPRARRIHARSSRTARLSGDDKQLVDQYVTLVSRAAGASCADRHADDVVHAAGRAGVAGQQHRHRPDRHHHQVGPVPRPRGGGGDVRSHARHHHRRAQGARPRPRPGQQRRWSATTTRRTRAAAPGTAWRTTGRQRELAPHAEGHQRLDRQRGVREAARASSTSPRRAAPPTSTTRSSTGATSSASTTSATACPCLLAGSAGGFIKPGRYLDYIDWDGRAYFSQEDGNVIKGIPHNQFLVTALQAMGLAPADYETRRQGRATARPAPAAATPTLWATDYDLATVGQILPGIRP